MSNQSENLTYQQALECLLCNECEYISCERGIDDNSIIMLDGNAELVIDGSFNDDDYESNNWFLG
jgi:hypothetical protein